MRTPALPSPRRIAVGAGLALLAAGLTPIAASANPAGTGLVISEVYGGGGNGTGSSFKADFVELYNPTSSAIDVSGWSVQYRSTSGTTVTNSSSGITPLTGRCRRTRTTWLPRPPARTRRSRASRRGRDRDRSPWAVGAGQVLLVNNTTASTVAPGTCCGTRT